MALAVAREGKQPTSLFGNLPGGSQLTLWYLDWILWIGLGWVFETSLAALSSHSDIWMDFELDWVELGTYLVDLSSHSDICIDLEWVFETYLAPSSLSDIMLLNVDVDWVGSLFGNLLGGSQLTLWYYICGTVVIYMIGWMWLDWVLAPSSQLWSISSQSVCSCFPFRLTGNFLVNLTCDTSNLTS